MIRDQCSAGVLARAAGLGAVAGLRTQLPLALLALAARQGTFAAAAGPPLSLLRSAAAPSGLSLLTLTELIIDKLPIAPSRLQPGPLLGRLVVGGAAGAAITAEADCSPLAGALLGAVGAGLGAEIAYHARVTLDRLTGLPDPVWGTVEDGLALALGLLVIRSASVKESEGIPALD